MGSPATARVGRPDGACRASRHAACSAGYFLSIIQGRRRVGPITLDGNTRVHPDEPATPTPTRAELTFRDGYLLLRGIEPTARLPAPFRWDHRLELWTAEAWRYREVQ